MKIQSYFPTLALLGLGTYKTYKDYKKSPENQKNATLLRNGAVISLCALTVGVCETFLSGHFNSNTVNKFLGNTTKETNSEKLNVVSEVVCDCVKDILINAAGLLSGIGFGQLFDKIFFKNKNEQMPAVVPLVVPVIVDDKKENKVENNFSLLEERIMKSKLGQVIVQDEGEFLVRTGKVLDIAGYIRNPLERPLIALYGFDLSKEKNIKKALQKTSTALLGEVFIPTFLMSIVGSVLKKNKWYLKFPAIVAAFVSGSIMGNKVQKAMEDKLYQNKSV